MIRRLIVAGSQSQYGDPADLRRRIRELEAREMDLQTELENMVGEPETEQYRIYRNHAPRGRVKRVDFMRYSRIPPRLSDEAYLVYFRSARSRCAHSNGNLTQRRYGNPEELRKKNKALEIQLSNLV